MSKELEALEISWQIANNGFPNGNDDIQKLRYGIRLAKNRLAEIEQELERFKEKVKKYLELSDEINGLIFSLHFEKAEIVVEKYSILENELKQELGIE